MDIIKVKDLKKEYKIVKKKQGIMGGIASFVKPQYEIKNAVSNINFTVKKGESIGFIGPNGAGKSTTIKMLSGILVPTSGEIECNGISPYKNRKKHAMSIGAVFGQRTQLWWDLPVIDTYNLLKYIYKIPDNIYMENLDCFKDLLGLRDFINQPVRQLSLGQRMRADIGASLLHNPEIVFLDEPTIGLDIVAKIKLNEFINFINKNRKVTVILTTHDMDDIEKICKRMIIIDKGKLIYDGTIENIKEIYGNTRTIIIELGEDFKGLRFKDIKIIKENNRKVKIQFEKNKVNISDLVSEITSSHIVIDISINEPEIESIIKEIYEGGISLSESLC